MAFDFDSIMEEGMVGVEDTEGVQESQEAPADTEVNTPEHEEDDPNDLLEKIKKLTQGQESVPEDENNKIKSPEEFEKERDKSQKPQKPKKDAQSRIRELARRNKEYQEKYESMQRSLLEAQQKAQAQQEAFQQKFLELEERRLARDEEEKLQAELASLDPNQRAAREFSRDLEEKASKKAASAVAKQIEALQSKLDALTKREEEAKAFTERQQRQQLMERSIQSSLEKHAKARLDENTYRALEPTLNEMMLAYSTAYGVAPEKIAPQFVKFLDAYAASRTKTLAKSKTVPFKDQKKLPSPGTGKTGKAASKLPTLAEARKMGYNSLLDYQADQFKRLFK